MKEINNIKISRVTVDDAEGIQNLTAEASRGMYKLCGWSDKEIDDHFSTEKINCGSERLKKLIPDFTEKDILFVAKDGYNKIIGFCFAERKDNINRVEAVYVRPDYQGTGLAQKLYYEAYNFLNQSNSTYLEVFTLNSKAISFYKKLGYVETGKKVLDKRFLDSTGKILEALEMVLLCKK